jgi:hypothetical protein
MDILTITCHRDLEQMLIQSESIHLFVESCKHWVVINDPEVDINYWYSLLSPYYIRHELEILSIDWNMWPDTERMKTDVAYKGYILQQVFKLSMFDKIKKDYVCLDSKNFFIDNINVNQFKNQIGSGVYIKHSNIKDSIQKYNFEKTTEFYANKLNVKHEVSHLAAYTPFVINSSIMSSIENWDEILDWFYHDQTVNASEFTLYGFLYKDISQAKKHVHDFILWRKHPELKELSSIENFLNFVDTRHYKMIAFSRRVLTETTQTEFDLINNWLMSLGFQNKLPYNLADRYKNTLGWIR